MAHKAPTYLPMFCQFDRLVERTNARAWEGSTV